MYSIITNYCNFKYLFSVDGVFYKGTKQGMLYHYLLLWSSTKNNYSFVNNVVFARGTKSYWVYPLILLVFHIDNVGNIFMFWNFSIYSAKEALRPIGIVPCKISNIIMSMFLEQKLFIKELL